MVDQNGVEEWSGRSHEIAIRPNKDPTASFEKWVHRRGIIALDKAQEVEPWDSGSKRRDFFLQAILYLSCTYFIAWMRMKVQRYDD